MYLETQPLALRNFDRPSRHSTTNTINQKPIAINSDLYMHTSDCRTVALQPAITYHYTNTISSSNVCSFHIQRQSIVGREITCSICWGFVLELAIQEQEPQQN
jgi:hypothetical protein